jgi:hypothetical protein
LNKKKLPEPKGEASTRNHLVISSYHALALEVRGIGVWLCCTSGRKSIGLFDDQ